LARVVVVDDEPSITMILEEILKEEGHRVFSANNALDGLDMVLQELPEIVLVDLRMPVMSGKSFIENIRSHPELDHIQIVILTGSVPGLDDFPDEDSYTAIITKPFDIFEVAATVSSLASAV